MRWRLPLLRATFCGATLLLQASAFAQDSKEQLPPFDVQGFDHSRVWVPWVFAFGLAALCIALSFKNPRRSHLD